jgi:hypothetical protein
MAQASVNTTQSSNNCIELPVLPTVLPFGISLGIPKVGIGINPGINFCCQFNVVLAVSTEDLVAVLTAAGITIPTLPLNGNLLKPIQATLIKVNTYIKNIPLKCPIE